MNEKASSRRHFLAASAATAVTLPAVTGAQETTAKPAPIVRPPTGKQILLSVKLGMIPKKLGGKELSLAERLGLAGEAGLDGVDFDQAGEHTEEAARQAVSTNHRTDAGSRIFRLQCQRDDEKAW